MNRVFHAVAIGFFVGAGAISAQAETAIERGAYLVQGPAGCGNCHTPFGAAGPDWDKDLGGRLVEDIEPFTAYAPNITPGGAVKDWSDAEFARAIREGLRPDGSLIGPPMPFPMYRGLSDDDVMAIVAYLRTVPAVDTMMPASVYRIPLPPAYGPPVDSVMAPARAATAEYGEYMAKAVSHCMECHTPFGPMGPMVDTNLGQGGFEFHGPWGTSVASNLTTHDDGLAAYSDAQVADMITKGVGADGKPLMPPMPYGYLAKMTPEDLEAVILYLRSLPPIADAG